MSPISNKSKFRGPYFKPQLLTTSDSTGHVLLRRGSNAARLLDCGSKSQRRNVCLSVASVVCGQIEIPATGRSLAQMSLAECGVSESDRETSWRRS